MMRGYRSVVSLLVVLVVLYVATVAKIPTKFCRCHDRNTTQEQRSECPFKKLRVMSGLIVSLAPQLVVEPRLNLVFVRQGVVNLNRRSAGVLRRYFDAQAPPLFSAQF